MKEILISTLMGEHQVAIVKDGELEYFFAESPNESSIVGHIYFGTVVRVLPGMECAFLDIGQERTAFLHLHDIQGYKPDQNLNSIKKYITEGQRLLVQVLKDPISTKGARLTSKLTLASSLLVYMPYESCNGISSSITKEEERERLESILSELPVKGLIARTAACGQSKEQLVQDCSYLKQRFEMLHEQIMQPIQKNRLVLKELPLYLKVLRDFAKYPIERLCVDDQSLAKEIQEFIHQFLPSLQVNVSKHEDQETLFHQHSIYQQIKKALKRTVSLKSGASIVIEETESMTTIDVNTSGFIGKINHHDTVLKTNFEAIKVVAQQVKLRNLGGIIIIDFIDMEKESDRIAVQEAFEKEFEDDIQRSQILPISSVGLLQMTRKRTTESLTKKWHEACPTCHGYGHIKTQEARSIDVLSEVLRLSCQPGSHKRYKIQGHPLFIETLSERLRTVKSKFLGLGIYLECLALPNYAVHEYEIFGMAAIST